MTLFWQKLVVSFSLGIGNVIRLITYRVLLSAGFFKRIPVSRVKSAVDFFGPSSLPCTGLPCIENWSETAILFGHIEIPLSRSAPIWSVNVISRVEGGYADLDWWKIPDFDSELGDIKGVWELSRFDWVMAFAQRVREGDSSELERLNGWLRNWCENNPSYKGYNWKCGQEASIRVMHLAVAAIVLGQIETASENLLELVRVHLRRIAPSTGYAMAQDNNHGTSEGAALYIGGDWLIRAGDKAGAKWKAKGVRLLEERGRRLISEDGTFSQYSTNYHRLVLDTYSLVEVWRSKNDDARFSKILYERLSSASKWLVQMTDQSTGAVPNIGANDSANLLPLTNSSLRDFRPAVQLATALFAKARAIKAEGLYDLQLKWLGVSIPSNVIVTQDSYIADAGGFAVLRQSPGTLVMRFPRFRFRPSHSDALHIDLFCAGENFLRDGGSFSYAATEDERKYFSGVASHNTVQFDRREQMPKLGRFLWGSWLKTDYVDPLTTSKNEQSFGAGYTDRYGASHKRSVRFGLKKLYVVDEIDGFKESALLRWRLAPSEWLLKGTILTDGTCSIEIESTAGILRIELVVGWESVLYMQKREIPVLEVELATPGTVVSHISWSS
tara:strand:- start:118 stop:1953 length:1836 start_codon:yes stop_codon:yes gene_type:complete